MAKVTAPQARWQDLGEELKRRRVDLSAKYKSRAAFSRETHVHDRMLSDLEEARRYTYRSDTLRAVEGAYQLADGAIRRFVHGDSAELELADGEQADADPLTASEVWWDGELAGPEGGLFIDEVLRWRDETNALGEPARYFQLEMGGEQHESSLEAGADPERAARRMRALLADRMLEGTQKLMGRPQEREV